MAVARGQGDAAKGSESGSDVGRGRDLKVFAGLDAEAHQQHRYALIVGIWSAVCGAVLPRPSGRRKIPGQ